MELWDAYDSQGALVEGATLVRGEPIPLEYRHLVVEVVVQHVDGSYLLMKRAYDKPNYPGFWQIGAGGSVLQGEQSVDGAIRELQEESGITPNTIMQVGRHINHCTVYDIYLAVTDCDKDGIVLQEGETTDYKWVDKDELVKFYYTYKCMHAQQLNLADFVANIVDYRIIHLREHPEYQPLAADWLASKWGIEKDKYFASMQDSRTKGEALPQWYIAMIGYRLVGAVGVVALDVPTDKEVSPCVVGLYVEEDCRGKGIARALLDRAEKDANSMGIEHLYLLTKQSGYYEKLGWKYLRQLQKQGGTAYRVYVK